MDSVGETTVPSAWSGSSSRMLKPWLSKTEKTSFPVCRATESVGDSEVMPLTPVAMRVTRRTSLVPSVIR